MTRFQDEATAISYVFRSLRRWRGRRRGEDANDRNPHLGKQLLERQGLLTQAPLSAVISGSKGKGSVCVLAARTLHALGLRIGTLTSPHLVAWYERIRVDGRAIPQADFLRILNDLAPSIDAIEHNLKAHQHLSPQAIFLAIALRYFAESGVEVALLEVGRGGRFDDVSVVPKRVAAFTPIFREHIGYLGKNLARIAWHKSGILSTGVRGISTTQRPVVRAELARQANEARATLRFLEGAEGGRYLGEKPEGAHFYLRPYGELQLALAGRHQAINAALALSLAATLFSQWKRTPKEAFSVAEMALIQPALAELRWPGRLQILQRSPTIIMDGAIHSHSARAVVNSLRGRLASPIVSILCIPRDKGYHGVYRALAALSGRIILTETLRNPILRFPPRAAALELARSFGVPASFQPDLGAALDEASTVVGTHGSILIIGTQSILADAALRWRLSYDRLW